MRCVNIFYANVAIILLQVPDLHELQYSVQVNCPEAPLCDSIKFVSQSTCLLATDFIALSSGDITLFARTG